MGALVLALTSSIVIGGALWAIFGSRFKIAKDSLQNDILNLVIYFAAILLIWLPIVIFVLG